MTIKGGAWKPVNGGSKPPPYGMHTIIKTVYSCKLYAFRKTKKSLFTLIENDFTLILSFRNRFLFFLYPEL